MTNIQYNQLEETPSLHRPIITTTDARRGYITRYFVKKINDKYAITEIDGNQYERFKINPLFTTTSLKWIIVGQKQTVNVKGVTIEGVQDMNKKSVIKTDLTFPGLYSYIFDYLEFWQYEV